MNSATNAPENDSPGFLIPDTPCLSLLCRSIVPLVVSGYVFLFNSQQSQDGVLSMKARDAQLLHSLRDYIPPRHVTPAPCVLIALFFPVFPPPFDRDRGTEGNTSVAQNGTCAMADRA